MNKHHDYYHAVQHVQGFPADTILAFVAATILLHMSEWLNYPDEHIGKGYKTNHSAPFPPRLMIISTGTA